MVVFETSCQLIDVIGTVVMCTVLLLNIWQGIIKPKFLEALPRITTIESTTLDLESTATGKMKLENLLKPDKILAHPKKLVPYFFGRYVM